MTDYPSSRSAFRKPSGPSPLARIFHVFFAAERDGKPLSAWGWWLMFGLSTWAMANCFQTFRDFTNVPDARNGFLWVFSFFLLTPPLLLLIYDSYAQEKNRGRVEKPLRLFEWMMRRRFLLGPALNSEERKS